ncbi:hypothetical protein V6N12_014433 [Hibiscus sabdariffa]|uniref:Uncharacterized protein n=1 Tax=Hibiscus sabdariffa TaxID=183260 RepID=A0ABR2DK54_9ROSI
MLCWQRKLDLTSGRQLTKLRSSSFPSSRSLSSRVPHSSIHHSQPQPQGDWTLGRFIVSDLRCLESGLSVPSQELGFVARAKARVSWLLEREALREAGFTEQRILSSLGSGRITGR